MADYKRIISYLYKYNNGKKENNVGYARVEYKQENYKIYINLKDDRIINKLNGDIYFYINSEKILIGEMTLENGTGEFRLIIPENELFKNKYEIEDICGIFIFFNSKLLYITEWIDNCFEFNRLIENISNQFENNNTRQINNIYEDSEPSEIVINNNETTIDEISINNKQIITDENNNKNIISNISNNTDNQNSNNNIYDENNSKNIISNISNNTNNETINDNIFNNSDNQNTNNDNEKNIISNISNNTDSQNLNNNIYDNNNNKNIISNISNNSDNQNLDNNIYSNEILDNNNQISNTKNIPNSDMPSKINIKENLDKIPNEPNFSKLIALITNSINENNNKNNSENKYNNNIKRPTVNLEKNIANSKNIKSMSNNNQHLDIKDKNEIIPSNLENQVTPSQRFNEDTSNIENIEKTLNIENLKTDDNTFEKILKEFPSLPHFKNNEIVESVRIEPQDIGKLNMKNWVLGNNSFLIHGYYNYRYLMLGKIVLDNKIINVIGVPGVFGNKEKYIANIFGFSYFIPVKKAPYKMGSFGYWIHEIS